MLITEIEFKGYRNLGEKSLRFDSPVTALIGETASGKTSILNAIDCLLEQDFIEGTFFSPKDVSIYETSMQMRLRYTHTNNLKGKWEDFKCTVNDNGQNELSYQKLATSATVLLLNAGMIDSIYFDILERNLLGDFWNMTNDDTLKAQSYRSKYLSLLKNALIGCEKVQFYTEDAENTENEEYAAKITSLLFGFNGNPITLDCLSKGQRKIVVIITHIFIELGLINYNSKKTKETVWTTVMDSSVLDKTLFDGIEGIVMIDNLEDNLSVQQQKAIVPFLTVNFPAIQFILTTHSALISGGCDTVISL